MPSFRVLRSGALRQAAFSGARSFHSTAPRRVVHDVKTAEEFKAVVAKQPKVLVDCFAEWCGPCKAIAPILSKLSDQPEVKDKLHFVKFDVDQLPELSQELGVRAMPTFLFFDGGKKVDEMVGANPAVLIQKAEKFVS